VLKPYRMLLVVQGFCSVFQNDALGFNWDIGCCYVGVASGSIGSAIFDKGLVVRFHVRLLKYWYFLVSGGGACVLARRHGKKKKKNYAGN